MPTSKKSQPVKYKDEEEAKSKPSSDKFTKRQRELLAEAINSASSSSVDKTLIASSVADLFDLTEDDRWQWIAQATAAHNLQAPEEPV